MQKITVCKCYLKARIKRNKEENKNIRDTKYYCSIEIPSL